MKAFFTTIVCSVALLDLAGCSSLAERSQKLQLGMAKDAAVNLLGSDYSVVAARMDADGSAISVLKYQEDKKQDLYLYFRNDKLAQWGDMTVLKAMPKAPGTPETNQ